MKKISAIVVAITILLMTLAGCVTVAPANEKPSATLAATPLPEPVPTPEAPPESAAPEPGPVAAEMIPGLSPYFPADRIALPPGSKVLEVFEGEPDPYGVTAEYLETTALELPLTKTQAIEYFSKMLDQGDGDFYPSEENSYWIPEAITGKYPDVTSYAGMSVNYPHSINVRGIDVKFFIQEGGEKVFAVYIGVSYAKKPGAPETVPAELSMASLRQAFKDRNYSLYEDYLFAKTDGVNLVDGFEIWYEQKNGVTENIIFLELSDAAGVEKYLWYREGYALSMTYGLIYVEYHEDTDEVRGFIQDIIKAAGGK